MNKKEWELEDDEEVFEYKGFKCEVIRHPALGSLNGYVFIPKGHRYFGKDYDDLRDIECHGGLTYSKTQEDFTKIGFDCAHYTDYVPCIPFHFGDEVYRNMTYVKKECMKIVDQLIKEEDRNGKINN